MQCSERVDLSGNKGKTIGDEEKCPEFSQMLYNFQLRKTYFSEAFLESLSSYIKMGVAPSKKKRTCQFSLPFSTGILTDSRKPTRAASSTKSPKTSLDLS